MKALQRMKDDLIAGKLKIQGKMKEWKKKPD